MFLILSIARGRMSTESISRRLSALEAKLAPRLTQAEQQLIQTPGFLQALDLHGVAAEDFKRRGLGALPRDILRAIVERLKSITESNLAR